MCNHFGSNGKFVFAGADVCLEDFDFLWFL